MAMAGDMLVNGSMALQANHGSYDVDYPFANTSSGLQVDSNVTPEAAGNPDANCVGFLMVIYVFIFAPVCVVGLVGNTLSLVVLGWDRRNSAATLLLRALSLADNLFLLTCGFAQMFTTLAIYYEWESHENDVPYLQVSVWPLIHITQLWTVLLTVLIAANRYIAICRPFQAHKLCSMSKVRLQLGLVTLFAVVYNIPRFFEYQIKRNWDNETNTTSVVAKPTAMKESEFYQIIYENAFYCLFVFLGPLVVLIVLNVCLIRELWAARQRYIARSIPIPGEEEEQNLTLVMIVIMLIFVVCQTPAFLNQILSYVLGNDAYACGTSYYYFFHISNLIVSTNSSTNFFVYCVFRAQFRERLHNFCIQTRYALKHTHTDSNTYDGRTMSVYSNSGHIPGQQL